MRRVTITRRWLVNNLGVISIMLFAVAISGTVFVRSYYYGAARQYLTSRINMISSILQRSYNDPAASFSAEVRSVVENWSEKDKTELMVVDANGRVGLTSSGFIPEEGLDGMTDFEQARESGTSGFYTGKMSGGENIMAVCLMLPDNDLGYTAIRLVSSMEKIDRNVTVVAVIFTVICVAILMLMFASGLYFVKSIVIPVRQIGTTARRYAVGDFSVRITKKNDDEIGELCDIVNHMASELELADQMKNEFISSVSHELRTPLTAIKGWAETVESMPDDGETVGKGMRVISGETERLSRMVEDLLDFSRMQNGKFSLNKDTMDILAELGDAVLIYAEKAKNEGIEIIYDEPDMLPFVYGDRNRLRQVFVNIIDNAIKYSDKGGVVSVQATMSDPTHIEVDVSDTGCGISPQDLPKVKTKFYKANQTRRGSGIGLAVADEIVTLHGGRLEIFSEQGVGTTVTVTIPVKRS
ncbi:MAG: HAMP domain-containing histidine kinase [Ruminococcus sp.]|nr:HAMP domain-containing histidine kinase [Ruminococcus sp.]MCM1479664.1 HAMP domain-containing histidine kinase [Muribaculaceae bacterium]